MCNEEHHVHDVTCMINVKCVDECFVLGGDSIISSMLLILAPDDEKGINLVLKLIKNSKINK